MFLSFVKRLRIMRTSEANGLAPRSEERSAKQRGRPIKSISSSCFIYREKKG
ncbi:hypothetical protein SOVF_070970 [Spinacia oleracea]|nr:hypothetical protein SOVF_070970 [Spinacia oleracea]